MKHILILSILTLGLLRVQAQAPARHSLQLGWGIGYLMRQDLTVSPFIHKDGSPINVSLAYTRSGKLEQQVALRFALYEPSRTEPYEFNSLYNGRLSTIPHSFKMIDLDYSIGKTLVRGSRWSLIAGGKWRNFIYASDYYFGDSGPSPMFISFGLDIWVKTKYQVNDKNYLKAGLSLPIVSYIYRNPYLAQDDEYFETIYAHNGLKELGRRIADGEWRSWGHAQRAELDLHYGYVLSPKLELGLGYRFSMNLNQSPTRFTQLENTFLVSGTFNF